LPKDEQNVDNVIDERADDDEIIDSGKKKSI